MIHRSKRRFTLIEILLVISIIAILTAILLPGLAKARGRARAAHCAGNLKQIALAAVAYSQDAGEWILPPYMMTGGSSFVIWSNLLRENEYLKIGLSAQKKQQPGICPENSLVNTIESVNYAMNNHLRGLRLSGVANHSSTVFLSDSGQSAAMGAGYCNYIIDENNLLPGDGSYGSLGLVHSGGANVIFLDGHSAPLRLEGVKKTLWNMK
jgi:prepilin-type processing-associated H-X9-DG protein